MGCLDVPSLAGFSALIGVFVKIIYFANTDWYLYNFRINLAQAMRERGHEVVLMSPPGEYGERLQAAGFRWIEFPLSRKGVNPLIEMGVLNRLTDVYTQENPDLVHHFTVKCVTYGSLAAKRAGVPHIVNAVTGLGHVFVENGLPVRLLRLIVRGLYRRAMRQTQVIFQNPDDQRLFQEMGLVNESHSTLIRGSGIDMNRFVPLPEPETSTPLVVLPARILWNKGVGEFVEAAHILRSEGVPARFALVGVADSGNPAAVSLVQLGEWQKEGVVEWWGWQEHIEAVFAMAHIVCLPSYREGVPRVLAEAAACSRALVTTDVPGCREVVRDGENGFLVPPRDASALADALRKLIKDAHLRRRMGQRGREIAAAEFSTDRVVSETIAIYERLLQDKAAG